LKYELTSLARDGTMLWLGACPYRGNGLLFDTVKKKWLAQIPVPFTGHLLSIARQGDTLWIAPGSKGSTVVAMDITSFHSNE